MDNDQKILQMIPASGWVAVMSWYDSRHDRLYMSGQSVIAWVLIDEAMPEEVRDEEGERWQRIAGVVVDETGTEIVNELSTRFHKYMREGDELPSGTQDILKKMWKHHYQDIDEKKERS